MLTDNEIKRVNKDALGFKAWARTLKEIACSSETPITIGIYGKWGSGKTSLMRMTEDLLKRKRNVKTVWFDAWKFDKTLDLRVALINAVLRRIQNDCIDESLRGKVGDLLKRVNWLGLGKIALSSFLPIPPVALGGMGPSMEYFIRNPEDIPEKTQGLIGNFQNEFKELVERYIGNTGRLVVFIDDLDRCIPEKAIDILEAIKLFLNVEGTLFMIGADKKVIEGGILLKYGEKSGNWGRNYLDKIIQIPVNLPPLRKDIITKKFILRLGISEEIKKYANIIAEVGDNPRTIKRLLNRFEIQRVLARRKKLKVECNVMAKLVVIEFRWPDFYADLISIYSETQNNLVKMLKEISTDADFEEGERLEEWKTFKKYLNDKRLMKFLLEDEPVLVDIDLDHYVYMGRSTADLEKSAENYFSIALTAEETGDYTKAIENYSKALELNPKYEDAWNNKGIALDDLGDYREAIRCYDKALELNPNHEKAWNNKGIALHKLGKHEEAIKYYDNALDLNPNHENVWNNKGYALYSLGKPEEAIECYDRALVLNPNHSSAWNNKGYALYSLGKPEEAIECYDKALKLNRKYEQALNNKGIALDDLGKPEEAVECYDEALKLNPKYEQAWNNKGNVFYSVGEHEEAIECYDEALKLNPKYEQAWNNKGNVFYSLKMYEEAIKYYDRAIELNLKYLKAWNNKGNALHNLGKYEESIKCYDKVLEINPDYEELWNIKGSVLYNLGKYEEALECCDKALELNQEYEDAWVNKGIVLEKLGQKEEAEKCFQEAERLSSPRIQIG
ncbi:MAG: tetratricopeptide repeat protein [Theionarchaea archaeon]|nr:tetratricopeptide repeat protein [Theionarchaea archaeon]